MTNYDISQITELMSKDTIFMPKAVLCRSDIYDESKLLFASVFTYALNKIAANGRDAETISDSMKNIVRNMTIGEVQYECVCTPCKAAIAKSEVLNLINHTNVAACLREREVE
jgi:hypothetical protein